MIRLLDIVLSVSGLIFCAPVLVLLCVLGWLDTKSPLFHQERVGRYQKPFILVKFRSMVPNTESVATHFVDATNVTLWGHFLRRSKLDELPQLWNVLKGDMSLVGPRPCLFNQQELIEERAKRDVFDARPGITGLAQIRAIDMSKPSILAETDAEMLSKMSILLYLKLILATLTGSGLGDRIRLGE